MKRYAFLAGLAVIAMTANLNVAASGNPIVGAVYTMSNAVAGNQILLFDRQFQEDSAALQPVGGAFATTAVWLVIGLTALNVVSTLLECGFGACADNPVAYELLKRAS